MAALAHAGHDQPPRRAADYLDGPAECVAHVAVQGRLQRGDALALKGEDAKRRGNDLAAAINDRHRRFGNIALFGAFGRGSR